MNILFKFYHIMYENPFLFKLNCFFLRTGIEKQIAYRFKTVKKEKHATENKNAKSFFNSNINTINKNLELLADEKSKKIYKTIIDYRIHRKPLKKDSYSLNDQYFVKDFVEINDQEVFIDCGAFVGDTLNNLFVVAQKNNKKIKKAVAFEPEHKNYTLLKKYFSHDSRIIPIEAGVSDNDKEMSLIGEHTYARLSTEENTNGTTVKLKSIDNTPECSDATYIKMDIEGAEMSALIGATKTIKKNKPKLAICIYHGYEDMIRIIPFIHDLNPSYKLYIRHHSRDTSETVLYAIP